MEFIKEQKHHIWKNGTIISAILCLILFVIFWNIEDPFWISISRLGSFIFFTLSVLGYLKWMNGPLEVSLDTEDEFLVATYRKNGKKIHEEQFERDTIKQVKTHKKDKNMILKYLEPEFATFKISFTDTDRELYLFEFGGRALLFSPEDQKKIITWLSEMEIPINNE